MEREEKAWGVLNGLSPATLALPRFWSDSDPSAGAGEWVRLGVSVGEDP